MKKLVAAAIIMLALAGCKGSSVERGRGFVDSRKVGEHPGATIYEDRLELRGGIITCITVVGSSNDVSISCDWGS